MKASYNQLILLLLMAGVVLCSSSCKKWLDVQPVTRLDKSELFKTEAGYRDALIGVYAGMSGTALYGREMTFATLDVLAGYYTPAYQGNVVYYNFFYSYPYKRDNAYKNTDCVNIIDAMWGGLYNQVANLNSILEAIDGSRSIFSGDNYEVLKGEAIGLRAFLHLDLLRMYGPSYMVGAAEKSIPFVDTLSSLVSPLLTVDAACTRIIRELERALVLLDKDPIRTGGVPAAVLASNPGTAALAAYHNRRYHFNYYAVKAALARAYLWKGDKLNALKYAKEVIAVQASRFPWVLDANLTSISSATAANKDRTFTTEHIFALNVRNLENDVPNFFSTAGAAAVFPNVLPTTASVKNRIYESNTVDPRNQYLFSAFSSNFFSSKLYQDEATSVWFKYQVPLMRISEMYYIAAECEPAVADGMAWLNTVRETRKLAKLTSATVTSSQVLMNELQKEYQKEFIGEGQLWYFYKRLNFESLPYAFAFYDTRWYVFDMPDEEYANGGR